VAGCSQRHGSISPIGTPVKVPHGFARMISANTLPIGATRADNLQKNPI
jgi:hypothetical protein